MTARRPASVARVGHARVAEPVRTADLVARAGALLAEGYRLGMVAAHDEGSAIRVVYLFLAGAPDRRVELHVTVPASDPRVPSLGALSFPASRFERAMHDLFGVVATDHPLPHRLIRHAHWPSGWHPMRADAGPLPPFADREPFPFVEVEGAGVYEVPVGPVHAGLIEPGHFRFSVVGESVIKLKARLWFLHRGIEKLFEGEDALLATPLAERISGDTSAGHALAHVLAVEDALQVAVPEPARVARAMLVELERLYNHAADIGALAMDVGFSLANSHALRIREELLRINEATTGHRLLRGAIVAGGVRLRALPDVGAIAALAEDLADVAAQARANSILYDRFAGTAILTRDEALDLGCLGYVARASGVATDARVDHPRPALPSRRCFERTGTCLRASPSGYTRWPTPRPSSGRPRPPSRVSTSSGSTRPSRHRAGAARRLRRPFAAGSASSRDGAGPSSTGWRRTGAGRLRARASSTRRGSTGQRFRSPCGTRSSRTSR